ncbi:family 78 glycoside hydrolase catalytic domain [Companilactobacillus allii]|uniref:alpha-L-rhamnosidase n=1 Tax=Companilactobacillus allii TaxID=1847728 RepID=A0A1P8Q0K2_9LACO|nr:family 78 glycoside hydrolase catalytic domain [Companilactobacillus allii]APX71403.1 alfa-L-rhamnosidase [Companilactobacillus allii]USQ68483.1 family 78 glycoside hydrolase catalytic domain [Companilactobacillus allii]
MEIEQIRINHMNNPIGFELNDLFINGTIHADKYPDNLKKRLIITTDNEIVFKTEWQIAEDLIFKPVFQLQSKTRYNVKFELKDTQEIISKSAFFETGLMTGFNNSQWIGTDDASIHGLNLIKQINVPKEVSQGRLYVSGLGVYEVYIDDQKIGTEYLAPGFTNYNYYVQIATHDITKFLQSPGVHTIRISLGDGWYRGKLGIKEHGGKANQYGNALMANAEIDYSDNAGVEHNIGTDDSWQAQSSQITHSGIYYGEDLDQTVLANKLLLKTFEQPSKHLKDRLSLPIKEHESFRVKEKIITPSNGVVLDFGQNMAGWVTFKNTLPKGTKVELEYGEIIQNGELYRGNLRSARATFTYVSDGQVHPVRPHFSYFGFRYVKLIGFPNDFDVDNFQARALYSDMESIGNIKSDNKLVNQLFSNVQWGQRSNFMDVPTDCSQRDERLGWTGDAAIFAKTASYNMDTYQFNRKYSYDIAVEQSINNGKVPLYVPAVDGDDGGKAVWSDVATIIPWISYLRTKDKSVLLQNFGAMMSWVDWVHDYAKQTRNEFLWLDADQLGDWLALDTEDIMHLKGKTPDELIASAYYYQSVKIVADSAEVLNAKREHEYYQLLSEKIKESFITEFFTGSGRLITDTQTALSICLNLRLYPHGDQRKLADKLVERIEKDRNHLTTGFVGTPALLPALSQNNQNELAVQLFLNEDYPSWLYQVKLGATTIWERWDSVNPDGKINDNGMNSLNHYSTGAVMQWAYEYLLGIKQGNQLVIKPEISPKFSSMEGYTQLTTGQVRVAWKISSSGSVVKVILDLPYNQSAVVELPKTKTWLADGVQHENGDILTNGHHEISYQTTTPLVNNFDIHTALAKFIGNKDITNKLNKLVPFWGFLNLPGNMEHFKDYSILQLSQEMKGIGFSPLTQTQIDRINQMFMDYKIEQIKKDK